MTALVAVVGAQTFAGRACVRALHDKRIAVRSVVPPECGPALRGVLAALGELREASATDEPGLHAALEDCSAVVLAPALGPFGHTLAQYEQSNVVALETVLAAVQARAIPRLLLLSSERVCAGNFDRRLQDDALEYAVPQLTPYGETLALGESLVLAADGASLRTLALRPGWLWGAGDDERLPTWLRWQREGRLSVPGDGRHPVPCTLATNLAAAALCALASPDEAWGQPCFVTDDERVSARAFFTQLMGAVGAKGPGRAGPLWLAYAGAVAGEMLGVGRGEARARVSELGRAGHYNLERARKALGYAPVQSVSQGVAALAAWAARVGGLGAIERGGDGLFAGA